MSQTRTPSSFGLLGSSPQPIADFCNAVIRMLPCDVTWMVQVLLGPGMNLTNLGSFGSVTSTMLQP
jgi:hypothetical protein